MTHDEYVKQAEDLIREGRFEEAAALINPLLSRHEQPDAKLLFTASVIYEGQGKFLDALGIINEVAEEGADIPGLYYHLGNVQKGLENLKAAAMSYARSIEMEPEDIRAYNSLGCVYTLLEEHDKARAILSKGLSLAPSDPDLMRSYATLPAVGSELETLKPAPEEEPAEEPAEVVVSVPEVPAAPVSDKAPAEPAAIDLQDPALFKLFKYLMRLSESLPEDKREEFMHSSERSVLEGIIKKLSSG
jgi:tetratricopeptide (TPR) repeat protein